MTGDPRVVLGHAFRVQNPALSLDVYGSPVEVARRIVQRGLTLVETLDRPETTVDAERILQEQPLLRIAGGLHAEELLALQDWLDRGSPGPWTGPSAGLRSGAPGAYVPLLAAAAAGDEDRVERLLGLGALVDLAGDLGMTPLHWAAARGHHGTALRLLQAGAARSARNWFCLDSGDLAALNGWDELAARLGHVRPDLEWPLLAYARLRGI